MKKICILILFLITIFNVFAEESEYETILKERVAQVINDSSYIVTPGDRYILFFSVSNNGSLNQIPLMIESDYTANLSFFGKINCQGLSYEEFQEVVESIIEAEYPKSYPQLVIVEPGGFTVSVEGEVTVCTDIKAWGFTKLTNILSAIKTDYSSVRSVEIQRNSGETFVVDTYQALYFGDKGSNPYLQRKDKIILKRRYGRVSIDGAVFRPGSYEIFERTFLSDVIETLCGGVLPLADLDRIQLKRFLSEENKFGETQYIRFADAKNIVLKNMDQILIPKISDYQPKVFFQGAVGTQEVSNKLSVRITAGDKLSFVARKVSDQFTLSSDLENVMLSRSGVEDPLYINLDALLHQESAENDIVLKDGDIIVVPFRQYKVNVADQVLKPGQYPYIANRTWDYYVGLAGGFKTENHIGTKVKIKDVYGAKHDQDERIIEPEDVIYAPTNHPMYYVRRYGSDIAVLTSTIIAAATLVYTVNKLGEGDMGNIVNQDD